MSLQYKFRIAQEISRKLMHETEPSIQKLIKDISFKKDNLTFVVPNTYSSLCSELTKSSDIIKDINSNEEWTEMFVDTNQFIQHTLVENTNVFLLLRKPVTSVVDFSSPNIAKPFHFGHLRSTIIGNFIANISKYMNDTVIKLNYLGDWGMQFGILKFGLDMARVTNKEIEKSPLKVLCNAYVEANNLAEQNEDILGKAQKIFHTLEFADGESDEIKKWNLIRQITMKELSVTYERLGIKFDVYDWESNYSARHIKPLIDDLLNRNILEEEDGAVVLKLEKDTSAPLLKRDGSSLYLSRDFAAFLDRQKRFNFDRMLYVVDYSQSKHFKNLKTLVGKVNPDHAEKIVHVEFGRVIGLSSRKGTTILLEDILDEIHTRMVEKQKQTPTTKGEIGGRTADILGVSSVIVNDLKMKRTSHYNFHWDKALQIDGNTGCKLQYCHCRLFSIEELCGFTVPHECDPNVLKEPEALRLISEISRFDDVVMESYEHLAPSIFVHYLFDLCDAINKAHKTLRVKGANEHLGPQRLLMFNKARLTLNKGMKILGIEPLNHM